VPKSPGARGAGEAKSGKPWSVQFAASAAREIRGYRLDDPRFRPTLRELVDALKRNPLQYPKKHGKLKHARAVSLKYGETSWRIVFTVSETEHLVHVLSVGPHDIAYERAERRV
jgi:mRNA-degrading endonuclease RelE of RelBE toxin-antitoxin system